MESPERTCSDEQTRWEGVGKVTNLRGTSDRLERKEMCESRAVTGVDRGHETGGDDPQDERTKRRTEGGGGVRGDDEGVGNKWTIYYNFEKFRGRRD